MSLNDSFRGNSYQNYASQNPNQSLPSINPSQYYTNPNPPRADNPSFDSKRPRFRVTPPSREKNSDPNLDTSLHGQRRTILNPISTDLMGRSSSMPRRRSVHKQSWLEMLHDKTKKPDQGVSIVDLRAKADEAIPDETLMAVNQRAQTDLGMITDNYMNLFVEHSLLQEEYKKTMIQKDALLKQNKEELYTRKLEIELLKKQLEEKERSETVLKMDFESRLQRLRDDLAIEREERASLLEKLTELKTKVHELSRNTGNSDGNGIFDPKDRIHYEEKIVSLKFELETVRNQLIEKILKYDEEKGNREEGMRITRRVCRFGRIHFVGQPRPMNEIIGMVEKLNNIALGSRERLTALEEFSIFMNSTTDAIEKLGFIGALTVCAKSLSSLETPIVLRAAHVLSYLCEGNPNWARQVIELGGVTYLKSALISPDETLRIEAMAALAAISELSESVPVIVKDEGVAKIITLLEEGLQVDSESGVEMAKQAAQTLKNIARTAAGIKEIQMYGGIFSLLKAITVDNLQLKRAATDCLAACSAEPKYTQSLSNANMTRQLLSLFEMKDVRLAHSSAILLANICGSNIVKDELKRDYGLENVLAVLGVEYVDLSLVILKMLEKLARDKDLAKKLCDLGFIEQGDLMLQSNMEEVRKHASKALYIISCFKLLSEQFLKPSFNYSNLISNLDYEDNIDATRACFGILNNILKYHRKAQQVLGRSGRIIPNAVKLFESVLPLSQMEECAMLMPLLMRRNAGRKAAFSSKMEVTITRLLLKTIDFVDNSSDRIVASFLQFFGVIVEEEYQLLERIKDKGDNDPRDVDSEFILKNCIQDEGLLAVLISVMQKYTQKDKISWDVLRMAIYMIEVLAHNDYYVEELVNKGVIRLVLQAAQLAHDAKHKETMSNVISMLAFYSEKEKEWLNMCKPHFVKILCAFVNSNNLLDRKRAKTCLYNLSFCSLLAPIINELPVEDGIKQLVQAHQKDEEGFEDIFCNLVQDVAFRIKLKGFLPRRIIAMATGKDITSASDYLRNICLQVPAPLPRTRLYSMRQLMDQGYIARRKHPAYIKRQRLRRIDKNIEPQRIDEPPVGEDGEEQQMAPVKYYQMSNTGAVSRQVTGSRASRSGQGEGEEDYDEEDELDDVDEDEEGEGEDDEFDPDEEEFSNATEDEEIDVEEEREYRRKQVLDAQKKFLGRNDMGNMLAYDEPEEGSVRASDLGHKNRQVNMNNPWTRLVQTEERRAREAEENAENEEGEEGEGEEGDEYGDEEYQQGGQYVSQNSYAQGGSQAGYYGNASQAGGYSNQQSQAGYSQNATPMNRPAGNYRNNGNVSQNQNPNPVEEEYEEDDGEGDVGQGQAQGNNNQKQQQQDYGDIDDDEEYEENPPKK